MKSNIKKFLVMLVAVIIFIVCLLCIINGLLYREFGFIAWALIGLILSPIFIFRPETIMKTPAILNRLLGGEEIQKKPKEETISMPKKYLDDVLEEKQQYKEAIKEIANVLNKKEQNIQELKSELQKSTEIIKQYFWKSEINEFKYLDFFFVYNTKRILAWIVYRKQVNLKEFYSQAFFFGIKIDNIDTTLNVLKDFYMIEIIGESISPTIRANIFLDFINFKYPDFATLSEIIKKLTPPKNNDEK